jgi:hypothetical protein
MHVYPLVSCMHANKPMQSVALSQYTQLVDVHAWLHATCDCPRERMILSCFEADTTIAAALRLARARQATAPQQRQLDETTTPFSSHTAHRDSNMEIETDKRKGKRRKTTAD